MGPGRAKSSEKDRKMNAQCHFLKHLGVCLAVPGGPEPLLGRCGRHPGVRRLSFLLFFFEKGDLCNSVPLCSRSVGFASPGAQVGATWPQKSEPNGPKLQVRGARTVNFVCSVRSCC